MIARLALIALFVFVCLLVLWLQYRSVMWLQRERDAGRLSPWQVKAGTMWTDFCLICDVFCNLVPASIVFLEVAQEPTVSQRLRRWVLSPACRNKRLATWFAVHLLNPYSNGGPHIPLQ